MGALEQVTTGFIAGVTIVFGIVALGTVAALLEPRFGRGVADLGGALAFGIGVVFLVVGRSELFTENLFSPVAAAIDERGSGAFVRLVRLLAITLPVNLVGGGIVMVLLTVKGALPDDAGRALVTVARETADKGWQATLVRAVLAGALIALLSYMLHSATSASARVVVAYIVGAFLALGPFDHVVVSALHLLFGVWDSDVVGYGDVVLNIVLSTAGNIAGGVLLITLTHAAQVRGR